MISSGEDGEVESIFLGKFEQRISLDEHITSATIDRYGEI